MTLKSGKQCGLHNNSTFVNCLFIKHDLYTKSQRISSDYHAADIAFTDTNKHVSSANLKR